MNRFLIILIVLNAAAFLYYGYNCLFSEKMTEEFTRFGLTPAQRKMTGALQLLGALGSLIGLYYIPLGFASTLGLCLLMFLGFMVRLRIKDPFLEALPSFILMLLNGVFAYALGTLLFLS